MSTTNQNQEQQQQLNENAARNLASIEEEIETSSRYFNPKPSKTYVLKMDPQKDKIVPVENDRFKDVNGNSVKRYECKITHVNNGREQKWTVSKTVCLQIIERLRAGYTELKIIRHGSDRATTYTIEGIE
jgi:lysine/ornithine N-monooxygenase